MIERYSRPEMASLFEDRARFARWLEVELLATEAQAELGVVPPEAAARCRADAPVIDDAFVAAVSEREEVTDHDVAAFVDVVQAAIGRDGAWIHHGLTSTDVVDTAQCWGLAQACDVLLAAHGDLCAVVVTMARAHRDTVMVGRTHGVHAEPTTFGAKVALWALQLDRDRRRLVDARASIAVGKLSGAVGTFSNIDPRVEAMVCDRLGLVPVPATQVVARDRHAQLVLACAQVGATIEAIALEIRLMARTEMREVEEGFGSGQKGSSAMPHKRNPITAERLCGLARLLRGYALTSLENVALWHERDISHSSAERVVLGDACIVTHYAIVTATRLLDRLVVRPEQMQENLWASHGLVFSQPVLLALVAAGRSRDDAYRIVQRNAMAAWERRRPFRELLEGDPDVDLDAAVLDEAFSLERAVRHAHRAVDALDDLSSISE
jgi:adenylosuccinate lyase